MIQKHSMVRKHIADYLNVKRRFSMLYLVPLIFLFTLWRQTGKSWADPDPWYFWKYQMNMTVTEFIHLSDCWFELESSKQMFPLCFVPLGSFYSLPFLLFHVKSSSNIDFCAKPVTCQSVRIEHTVTGTVAKQSHAPPHGGETSSNTVKKYWSDSTAI